MQSTYNNVPSYSVLFLFPTLSQQQGHFRILTSDLYTNLQTPLVSLMNEYNKIIV